MIISTPNHYIQPQIQSITKNDKVEYDLVDDYCFMWVEDDTTYRRIVYRADKATNIDWMTDLASVPDQAGLLGFKECGASDGAAILHDRGYQVFGALKLPSFPTGEFQKLDGSKWIDCTDAWTRLRCDKLFREMCIYGGMSKWRANVEFVALRVGAITPSNGIKWYFS
jgi:hypothetical protein